MYTQLVKMVKSNGYTKEKEEKYVKKLKVIKEIFKSLTKKADDQDKEKSEEVNEQKISKTKNLIKGDI